MISARILLISVSFTACFLFTFPSVSSGAPRVYELSLSVDLPLAGAIGTIQASSWYTGRDLEAPTVDDSGAMDRNRVNRLDRRATHYWSPAASRWSDHLITGLVVSPAVFTLFGETRNGIFVISVMYAESWLLINGMTGIMKNMAGRARPFMYNPDAPLSEMNSRDALRSFWSGHASSSFNAAVFFGTVFSDYYPGSPARYAVWAGMLSLASAVAVLRVRAGMHYPTDVLAGAAAGSVTGFFVPWAHRRGDRVLTLVPLTGEITGLCVVRRF